MEITKTFAIAGGTILTMDTELNQYSPGLILVENDILQYVGPYRPELIDHSEISTIFDGSDTIIIPGLINTHTHIGMSLFRSLADDTADRLRSVIIPLEKHILSEEIVYWASLHSLTEMILGGTTAFADMYFFSRKSAEACEQAGIRAVIGQAVTTASAPDVENCAEALESTRELITAYGKNPLISPAIAPHAPYSLSWKDHSAVSQFAEENKLPILSHLAEMPFEERYCLDTFGKKPIPFYHSVGMLNSKSTMAHCIHADEEDRKLLRSQNAGIAHNVSANSKSGKGIAPAYEFLSENCRIGLGTDGPMSSNTIELVSQLNLVSKMQKIRHGNPAVMTPKQVLHMATAGGAEALHMENEIGSLIPGKKADIVMISTLSPSMFPIYDPYAALVYSAAASDVQSVFVDGECIMHKRKLLTLDAGKIREAAAVFAEKISSEYDSLLRK